jgi:hypothetical protein
MLYRKMTYIVRHESEVSTMFRTLIRILIGDTLSPILWTLYLLDWKLLSDVTADIHCVPDPTGQTSVPPRPAVAISVYPLLNSVYGGRQRVVDACLSPPIQLWLYMYMSHGHSPATGVYVCLRASARSLNCCDFLPNVGLPLAMLVFTLVHPLSMSVDSRRQIQRT